MKVKDVASIKEYYALLKKDRKVMNWQEFAERIGYDRTYVSRVLNGHETLTQDFVDKINNAKFSTADYVSHETEDVTKKYIALLEKQNDINLKSIKMAIDVNQVLLESLFRALVGDPEKDKSLIEKIQKVLQEGSKVS